MSLLGMESLNSWRGLHKTQEITFDAIVMMGVIIKVKVKML